MGINDLLVEMYVLISNHLENKNSIIDFIEHYDYIDHAVMSPNEFEDRIRCLLEFKLFNFKGQKLNPCDAVFDKGFYSEFLKINSFRSRINYIKKVIGNSSIVHRDLKQTVLDKLRELKNQYKHISVRYK
jgi:hypothetical protein